MWNDEPSHVPEERDMLKAVGNDSTYITQLKAIMRANRKDLNIEDLKDSVESSSLLSAS